MQHPFTFHFVQRISVDKDNKHFIEAVHDDCKIIAEIGPDNSQPDGWNCDGLKMEKYIIDEDSHVSVVLETRSKRILVDLHPGTPFFAQAMAHFAEHEADNVTEEWNYLRERGEAA